MKIKIKEKNKQKIGHSITSKKKGSLIDHFKKQLSGGKFRMLNEKLYSISGKDALKLFKKDPSLFNIYHEGFREQVKSWPINPVDLFINKIKKYPKAIIGDFGCGDAKISQCVKNKVYSFDLVAKNEHVIACDISHVPLEDNSLDISIFCLSLMGTNCNEFLYEAYRVTKPNGLLLIAEVVSRFESIGGIEGFKKILIKLGWDIIKIDSSNTMFTTFELRKSNRKPQLVKFQLKVCKYKKQ